MMISFSNFYFNFLLFNQSIGSGNNFLSTLPFGVNGNLSIIIKKDGIIYSGNFSFKNCLNKLVLIYYYY